MELERESPFQPRTPVKPENFEGRKDIIKEQLPLLYQSSQGTPTHFFIKGKRGIGKTSLADYFKNIVEVKCKMLPIHVFNDGVHDLDSLIQQIVERILNKVQTETWGGSIISSFKKHVKSVEFLNTIIEFRPDPETIEFLKDNFPFFLEDIIKKLDGNKKGLFIIIDDVNGLSDTPEFANWYKSFADTVSTEIREMPLAMILTSYPENAQKLYNYNPSFNRIFEHIKVQGLHDSEVEEFFTKIFSKLDISINDDAMKLMVNFSSGLPNMMQEIGDGVFWINNDKIIDNDDALRGIIKAGTSIGEKYLQPALDKSIKSERYLSIFRTLGNDFNGHDIMEEYAFKRKDINEKLNTKERKAFSDFLKRAKELKILEYPEGVQQGTYTFTNNLYPIYFLIQYLNFETKKKK
ncbi:MAG: AAA family ATPase [Methanobrevibacter sp. CfCl-M3]